MSDSLKYILFVVGMVIAVNHASIFHFILPIMDSDEYFVDNNCIHRKGCPYKGIPCFTKKHSKYNILIEREQYLCDECMSDDEKRKLWKLHDFNKYEFAKYLMKEELSADEIKSYLEKYK